MTLTLKIIEVLNALSNIKQNKTNLCLISSYNKTIKWAKPWPKVALSHISALLYSW